MIILKQATLENIDEILKIIKDGQTFLKEQGLDQWQNGYPNKESITLDVNNGFSHILLDNETIVATAAIVNDIDPNYNIIYDGSWISNNKYIAIHRIATKKEYKQKGYASKIISLTKEIAKNNNIKSLRIDTHQFNIPMQKMLKKNGFIKCGIIYLNGIQDETNKRLAYECLIK